MLLLAAVHHLLNLKGRGVRGGEVRTRGLRLWLTAPKTMLAAADLSACTASFYDGDALDEDTRCVLQKRDPGDSE